MREVCVALLALLFGHNVFFFSASQGFLLLFFSLFFYFFFSCFSAAGGWCHEQTSGILANKLDLPRHTQRHTHTDALTHSTRPPYTGGKTAATRRKTANLKLLASCGSLWLPGFHHPPSSQQNPQHRQFQARQRQHLNVIMLIHVSYPRSPPSRRLGQLESLWVSASASATSQNAHTKIFNFISSIT